MKRTDITALFPDATDEQIQKIMDLNGGDINREKAGLAALQGQLTAAQAELADLKGKDNSAQLAAVQQELADLKAANALRDLRYSVSKETGVPVELLTGDTEDLCRSQAEAAKAYAKAQPPAGYPSVPDGGEVHVSTPNTTRDKFAEWMDKNFPTK